MSRRPRPVGLQGPFLGSVAVAEGAVTRAQLRGPSVRRLFQGVYAPVGLRIDHVTRVAAATLVLPRDAVVTGRSALAIHGVDQGYPDDPVEVAVRHASGLRPIRGVRLLRTEVDARDAAPWECARVAAPRRAALDLCRDRSVADVVAHLDPLVAAGLLDPASWASWLLGRHDKGVVLARRAALLLDGRAESPQESRVRVHLVEAGLDPVPQHVIRCAGGRVVRVDLAFVRQKLAVEYDGAWHASREQLGADRARLNDLQAEGWAVVHLTAADLRDPTRLVAVVRAALARRP